MIIYTVILILFVFSLSVYATYLIERQKKAFIIGSKGIIQHKLSKNKYAIVVDSDGTYISFIAIPEEEKKYEIGSLVTITGFKDKVYYFV